jgi:hypothetical protein
MTMTEHSMSATEYKWSQKVAEKRAAEICPLCRSRMKEMLRAEENHSVFIWFECTRVGCAGRKLNQYSLV